MGVRTTGRKLAMKAVYQAEIRSSDDFEDIQKSFLDESDYKSDTKSWAKTLSAGAWTHRGASDELIKKYAIDWDFSRINPIDKSILRIAFYELLHTDTHPNIVLNEAIEIAKKYSQDESPKFINGILGQYVKDTCSPA